MFDWNDLRAFLAVARGGSILTAAKSLRVNQTTVARRIEALEAALGLKLIDRDKDCSRMTVDGQDLLNDAEKIEQAVGAFANRAATRGREVSGALRVTSTEILCKVVITPALGDFRRRYPEIKVELVLTDDVLDLAAGEADVAIRTGIELPASDLVARKVATFDMGVYCSRDYARRRGVPRCAADLREHDLIVGDGRIASLPGAAWLSRAVPDVEPAFRSNTTASLLHALVTGLGVAVAPSLIADPNPELVHGFLIPEIRPSAWLVVPPQLKDAPRVRAFIDFMIPHFNAGRQALEVRGAAMRARNEAEFGGLRVAS